MTRLIALLILVIPGALATFGVKLMRDSLFDIFYPIFLFIWLQFIAGLLFFILGLAFIGGFIFYRDRKRSLTQDRYKQNN